MAQTQAAEHDSISSQDPSREEHKKTKSRRPPNTAFRQQRLKAWQPILTPKTVLPLFFIVGVIFAPIGGLLLFASNQVQEISIDYTECLAKAPDTDAEFNATSKSTLANISPDKVSATFRSNPQWGRSSEEHVWPSGVKQDTKLCILSIDIPDDIRPPILFYYRLTNFYQNHRRYVKSVDVEQLKGKARSAGDIKAGDCNPLSLAPDGRPYYPCGLIANSMFNDTFDNLTLSNAQATQNDAEEKQFYNMTTQGTSWAHEGDLYGKTAYAPKDVVPPPYWKDQYPDDGYDSQAELPNLHVWEEFQVWMRTAGLPTFSKLVKRNDHETLKKGTYRLKIQDRFPVDKYNGKKFILISTRTVMGGKNPFLGIAYLVVGGLCMLLGAVFLATHLIKPRKLGDHTYLTWNNDQPSTATTTGRAGGA